MILTGFLILLFVLGLGLVLVGIRTKNVATRKANAYNEAFAARKAEPGYYYRAGDEEVEAKAWADKFGYLPAWVGAVPIVIGLIIGAFACTVVVTPRTEGVLVTLGKVSDDTLEPGFHFKAPWQSVTEIDGTNKSDTFNNSNRDDTDDDVYHGAIDVRLGDGNVATAYVALRWRPQDGAAGRIFAEYRSDDPISKMRDNLVVPLFRDSVNATLGTYSPTAPIDSIDFTNPDAAALAKDVNLAPDFDALSTGVKAAMVKRLGDNPLVEVRSVSVSFLSFGKKTQGKIDAFLDEQNKTRIALQQQVTNTAQAAANSILSDSISNDPNVLVAQCYDLIKDGAFAPPAGFSCWPGSGSSVVIPGATK